MLPFHQTEEERRNGVITTRIGNALKVLATFHPNKSIPLFFPEK